MKLWIKSSHAISSPVPNTYAELLSQINFNYPKKLATNNAVQYYCRGRKRECGTDLEFPIIPSNFVILTECCSPSIFAIIPLSVHIENTRRIELLSEDIKYDTMSGFDSAFRNNVNILLTDNIGSQRQHFETILWKGSDKLNTYYLFEEDNILNHSAFSILFRKPIPYSNIKLNMMFNRVLWPEIWHVSTEADVIGKLKASIISNDALKKMVDERESNKIAHEEEKEMLQFAIQYLKRFRRSVLSSPKYSESTRRWIINGCLLAVMSPCVDDSSDASIRVVSEYTFAVNEQPRVGNGPLDYYFFSQNLEPAFVADGLENIRGDEDEEALEKEEEEVGGSFEAKQYLEDISLQNAMGQVCAQASDLLKSITIPAENPFKKQKCSSEKRLIRRVKSILSTAHHFLFFTFSEFEGNTIPSLDFLGKYSIAVLPKLKDAKDKYRDSGSFQGDVLSETEIMTLLRALYFFLRM